MASEAVVTRLQADILPLYVDTGNDQGDYERLRNAIETSLHNLADQGPHISAEVHSDDRVHKIAFDASAWFLQAGESKILELANIGWRGDLPADEVALFFKDTNPDISALFDYTLSIQNVREKKDCCGFECSVDEKEAIAWLMHHRQSIGLSLVDVDDNAVGQWVGLHYKVDYKAAAAEQQQIWRDRYKVSVFGSGAEYEWSVAAREAMTADDGRASLHFTQEQQERCGSAMIVRAEQIKSVYLSSGCQAADVDHAVEQLMKECAPLFQAQHSAWEFVNEETHEDNEACEDSEEDLPLS